MPRKPKTVTPPEPPLYQRPAAFPIYVYSDLTEEERQWFRQTYAHPTFQKILRNTWARKPESHPHGTGVIHIDHNSQIVANNRLHQLQGWEMHEAAFFGQMELRLKPKPVIIKETYSA